MNCFRSKGSVSPNALWADLGSPGNDAAGAPQVVGRLRERGCLLAPPSHKALEIDPFDELHGEKPARTVRGQLMERHQVGMRHVGQGPELLLEAENGRGIGPLQGLQGHRHAVLLVERPVNHSHATTAELAFDAIATQPLRAAGSSSGFAASVRVGCAAYRLVERRLGRLAEL